MAAERVVRITRTWDVTVKAEYGDTDESLIEKAKAGAVTDAAEIKNLLPEEDED